MSARVIVMGASTDGIQAIGQVLHDLPGDLAAPVLVVQHIGGNTPSFLPEILARTSRLPVMHPHDGQLLEPAHVYVAPPDQHLLIRAGEIHLSRGPKENYTRPAVDVLFRSAAIAYGPAVVGVVLTGHLFDGAAGLLAIKDRGGIAIVQEPAEAAATSMPLAAIASVPIDYRCKLSEIGPLLAELAADPPGEPRAGSLVMEHENRIAGELATDADLRGLLNHCEPTALVCPICSTTLHRLDEARMHRYRCSSGHAFSETSLVVSERQAAARG